MADLAPPRKAQCKGCAAEMVYVTTPTGATAPLVAEPSEDGTVLGMTAPGLPQALAVTLSGEALEAARASGCRLHLNHFANCPARDQFKTDKEAPHGA